MQACSATLLFYFVNDDIQRPNLQTKYNGLNESLNHVF